MLLEISEQMTFPLAAGCIAAVLHVLMGPDHLAAVAPFALESKRKAWKIGLFWGLGHLFGMLLIGILFMGFREIIPVEKISAYSEQLVGFVLVIIGIWAFYKIYTENGKHDHMHVHSDEPMIHKHKHSHAAQLSHEHKHPKNIRQGNLASFSIGMLHGLAGIAHFILFLPVASFENSADGYLYIFGFIFGIVLAMTLFATLMGSVSSFAQNGHNKNLFRGIRFIGGLLAILIGVYWMI
jgi:ABC-type nickel/cobalt efflux system permease component RcnA